MILWAYGQEDLIRRSAEPEGSCHVEKEWAMGNLWVAILGHCLFVFFVPPWVGRRTCFCDPWFPRIASLFWETRSRLETTCYSKSLSLELSSIFTVLDFEFCVSRTLTSGLSWFWSINFRVNWFDTAVATDTSQWRICLQCKYPRFTYLSWS